MKRSAIERGVAARLAPYLADPRAHGALVSLLELLEAPEAPTSVHDPAIGLDVHLADSLVALTVPEIPAAELVADLGAGAGLPGLVVAAALPRVRVVLVESVQRKCEFLARAIDVLELDNAQVVRARAEEWVDGSGRCDVITARALAPLPVLAEYAAPLLRAGGVLVAWKGAVDPAEAADGEAAAGVLGLALEPVRAVTPYAGSQRRTLYVMRKVAPTPPHFPRRSGIAAKRPLSATK